jgi:hypothetical protein
MKGKRQVRFGAGRAEIAFLYGSEGRIAVARFSGADANAIPDRFSTWRPMSGFHHVAQAQIFANLKRHSTRIPV